MKPTIVPIPAELKLTNAAPFKLNADTAVALATKGAALKKVATQFAARMGLALADAPAPKAITLEIDPALKELGNEGYRLSSRASGLTIRAASAAGVFYGLQSLRQLLPPQVERLGAGAAPVLEVPAMQITDKPRFGWRGVMLDCARHLFSVAEIKAFLDAMALQKLNVLHWHLVDDQGWRLQIRKYPKLTEVGGWRAQSPRRGNREKGDGTPYGGYYTQAQVREVVAYAAERFITVVPEIEMPGHAAAAIAAYPQLGNTDIPGFKPQVLDSWGIHPFTYAPSEKVFRFIADVMAEVAELFPSKYIHIGGDEALKDQWKQSKFAQGVIRKHGLKDEYGLQGWFVRRVETILASYGRRLIGWDEINEGGLSPKATMMVWRDWKWAELAIQQGNDVVMTPKTHCYLDYYQADPAKADEPEAIHGLITLEKAYSLDPVPPGLPADAARHVLGVQGNLWSEYLPDARQQQYMAFPRLCALAEVGWSPPEQKDWKGFKVRLAPLLERLRLLGVNYRPL